MRIVMGRLYPARIRKFQKMRRNADVRTVLLRGTLLCWLFAACIAAPANDGTYYTSGNQLLPLVETDIHVWREVLTLSWGEDRTADVDVYYAFYNPGEEKTVLMGFEADSPMYMDSLDLSGAHPYISGFTVKMNGKALPVAASIVRADTLFVNHGKVQGLDLSRYEIDEARSGGYLWNPRANDGVSIAFVYHFNATFKPGFNIVRHHYRYRMSESVYYHYELDYKLSPALRWANGKIGDFTLRIKTRDVPLHFMMKDSVFQRSVKPEIKGTGKWRRRTVLTSNWGNDKLMDVVEFFLRNATLEYKATDFRPGSELKIFSADCTGTSVIDMSTGYYAWRYRLYREGALNDKLYRIVRNLPFAWRGYVFKTEALDWFFRTRWWYIPNPDYQATLESLAPEEREWLEWFEGYAKSHLRR